jgi:hypothetical protein
MNLTFTQLGSTARACLAPGQRGKILAVFSKAIYFQADSGELFWMTTVDAPMHRRAAQIAPPLPGFSAGSPFNVQGHHLVVDSVAAFDIPDASPWHSPRPEQILPLTLLSSRIQTFFSDLDVSQAKGFGLFIPHILSSVPAPEFADSILRYAQPLVLDMAEACAAGQPTRIASIADSMIGLGSGLTPSGDDFLGGLFFALKTLRDLYPDEFADYAIDLEPYRSRTHLISFALLQDLANGHALAPLHSIINGLLGGEPLEPISSFVSQLTYVGHSTGWDELTGLLVGMLATVTACHCERAFLASEAIPDFTESSFDRRLLRRADALLAMT